MSPTNCCIKKVWWDCLSGSCHSPPVGCRTQCHRTFFQKCVQCHSQTVIEQDEVRLVFRNLYGVTHRLHRTRCYKTAFQKCEMCAMSLTDCHKTWCNKAVTGFQTIAMPLTICWSWNKMGLNWLLKKVHATHPLLVMTRRWDFLLEIGVITNITHFLLAIGWDVMRLHFRKMCSNTHFLLVICHLMRVPFRTFHSVTDHLLVIRQDEVRPLFRKTCNITHKLLVIGKADVMRLPIRKMW